MSSNNTSNPASNPGLVSGHAEYVKGAAEVFQAPRLFFASKFPLNGWL